MKASQCYVIRTLSGLFSDLLSWFIYLLLVLFVVAAFGSFLISLPLWVSESTNTSRCIY